MAIRRSTKWTTASIMQELERLEAEARASSWQRYGVFACPARKRRGVNRLPLQTYPPLLLGQRQFTGFRQGESRWRCWRHLQDQSGNNLSDVVKPSYVISALSILF
jgi:hypothetical protein